MLVLTRRSGELVMIGNDTIVHVRAVSGNRVVIGIEAPRELRILRGELVPFAAAWPPPDDSDAPCLAISCGAPSSPK